MAAEIEAEGKPTNANWRPIKLEIQAHTHIEEEASEEAGNLRDSKAEEAKEEAEAVNLVKAEVEGEMNQLTQPL